MGIVKIAKPRSARKSCNSQFVTIALSTPPIVKLEPIGAIRAAGCRNATREFHCIPKILQIFTWIVGSTHISVSSRACSSLHANREDPIPRFSDFPS